MLRHFRPVLIAMMTTLATTTVLADPGNGAERSQMLGKGNPFSIDELPPGRTLEKLKSLPDPARVRAMEWLHSFDFPANDLESMIIDAEGAILYVDPAPSDLSSKGEEAPAAQGALLEPAASAAQDAFLLHSRLSAPNVLYLDFDGHTFSNTAWSKETVQARSFDLDGSPSTFSETERNAIAEIWHRVAEDYAVFDIDVTTEEPSRFGPYTGRILITSKTDANGGAMPYNSGGGVAYINVWGSSDYASYYSPALVYYDNLAKGTTYIAEASAHEFGHNLGLSHDGTSGVTYYKGHGSGATSWAPIMGNSYYNNVTQWSKGEYVGANNTQDDIAVITSRLYPIADDHGDTLNDASPLIVDSSGQILVSNPEIDPHNIYPENKGIIEMPGDQDLFYFSAAAGQLDLTVTPAWDAFYRSSKRGANADIQASLLDAGGATVATSDPASETYANILASVSGGNYYLKVSGVGSDNYSDYASTGEYFISGSITPGEVVSMPPAASFDFVCLSIECSFSDSSSDSDGFITSWAWDFGDGVASQTQSPSHTYASAGIYSVSLSVTDNDGRSATTTQSVTVTSVEDNEPPVVTIISPGDGTDASRSVTLSAIASDNRQVSQINLYADNKLRCSGISSASCKWNLRKVERGTYLITVEATDAAGNRSSKSVTINVYPSSKTKGRGAKK